MALLSLLRLVAHPISRDPNFDSFYLDWMAQETHSNKGTQ